MKAGWSDAPLALQTLAMSNLPQFPSFCKSQVTPLAHDLVIPSPIVFARQFCGNKGEYIWLLRGIEPGLPRCYILMLCYKFHRFIDATTTVQD